MRTASNSPAKLTYRDFLEFPDDGKRHELIDGVHYVTRRPSHLTNGSQGTSIS